MLRKNATFFGGIIPLHPGYITKYGGASICARKKTQVKILRQPLLRKQAEWSCLLSKDKGFMRIVSKRDN